MWTSIRNASCVLLWMIQLGIHIQLPTIIDHSDEREYSMGNSDWSRNVDNVAPSTRISRAQEFHLQLQGEVAFNTYHLSKSVKNSLILKYRILLKSITSWLLSYKTLWRFRQDTAWRTATALKSEFLDKGCLVARQRKAVSYIIHTVGLRKYNELFWAHATEIVQILLMVQDFLL